MADRSVLKLSPRRIAFGYAAVASLWIAFSDIFVQKAQLPAALLTLKGIAFVGVTALLLYLMMQRLVNAVRSERARWQGVVEGIAEEVWVCDLQGKMTLINLPAVTAMGLETFEHKSVEEVLAEVDILNVDGRPRAAEQAPLLRSLRGEVVRGEEIMRHRRTGNMRYRQFSSAPVRDAAGAITGAVAIVRDVTELKRTEEALRKSEERFRGLVTASSQVLYRMSPDWDEMRWLKGGGFIADTESPSKDWLTRYIPPEDQLEVWAAIRKAVQDKRLFELEHRVRRMDGSLGWTISRAVPLLDASGVVTEWFGAANDVTARKHAEQALIRSEKLASVGRMAATIAHEINNPLAGAVNAVYLASNHPTTSPEIREALALADQELRRAAHITQQTLGFYRENGNRSPVALPKLIDEVLKIYARKLQERGISVECRYNCGPCREGCDTCFIVNAGEMRQIISNLLGNGMDALRDHGRLYIRVSRVTNRDGSGQDIHLTIADNGCGIRSEDLKRIFEPFFTTKQSVGTGLGLWITQELVRKHNGSIRVRTSDKGTVFQISIPAAPITSSGSQGEQPERMVTRITSAAI